MLHDGDAGRSTRCKAEESSTSSKRWRNRTGRKAGDTANSGKTFSWRHRFDRLPRPRVTLAAQDFEQSRVRAMRRCDDDAADSLAGHPSSPRRWVKPLAMPSAKRPSWLRCAKRGTRRCGGIGERRHEGSASVLLVEPGRARGRRRTPARPWQLHGHGLTMQSNGERILDTVVRPGRGERNSFQGTASAIGSPGGRDCSRCTGNNRSGGRERSRKLSAPSRGVRCQSRPSRTRAGRRPRHRQSVDRPSGCSFVSIGLTRPQVTTQGDFGGGCATSCRPSRSTPEHRRNIPRQLLGFALPEIGGVPCPHPLMLWWALLVGLPSLTRYEPAAWSAAVDLDRSEMAVPLEQVLGLAEERLPARILDALNDRSY